MELDAGLMDVEGVARLLDLTKQRVHQLRRREDFPAPTRAELDRTLWDRADIERWLHSHPCGALRWGPRGPG